MRLLLPHPAILLVLLLPAIAVCAANHPVRHVGTGLGTSQQQHQDHHVLNSRATAARCADSFDANDDFYGFGIRLGVYLQWVSSWIANTFSPEDAAANHDANSIFVLALATALAVAFNNASTALRPAEAYIMFSICFGFYFTVLSIFGFRLHFLQPETVREFAHEFLHVDMGQQAIVQNFKRLQAQRSVTAAVSMCRGLLTPFKISFTSAAFGKHYSLSWTGIVWRSGIASLVCGLNIYFWFYALDSQKGALLGDCGYEVFLFAPFRLDGAAQTAFKVLSIMLSIVPFYVVYVTYLLAGMVVASLFRDTSVTIQDKATQETPSGEQPRRLAGGGTRRHRWMNAMVSLLVRDEKVHENRTKLVPDDIELTELQQSVEKGRSRNFAPTNKQASVIYCVIMHTVTGAIIVCLIVFIEKTIVVNNIQGAYTIKSTGQLIPFIIGVASMLGTIKDISLDWLHEKFPNEEKVHFAYAGRIASDYMTEYDHRLVEPRRRRSRMMRPAIPDQARNGSVSASGVLLTSPGNKTGDDDGDVS